MTAVADILRENSRRHALIHAPFDPLSGQGSVGERVSLFIPDFFIPRQWIPLSMDSDPLVVRLREAGSVRALAMGHAPESALLFEMECIADALVRLRILHDFPFWCALFVRIKRKGGGDDILFRLNRPQRVLVERFEKQRLARLPIRLILLKARQWGGSTCTQLYMAWLQLVHATGLNSLIIAHQGSGSDEIKDMFDRMVGAYPAAMLFPPGVPPVDTHKLELVGKSGSIFRVPPRNCKIKIGTAERPDSCRGGDYNLVHCSEVGIWKATEGKTPEMILRSAASGVLLRPLTMIVYESTANGTGNFFHREYEAAKRGESQFDSLFIRWHDIDQYSEPIIDPEVFAESLLRNRYVTSPPSSRAVSGAYLWRLWNEGATLEAINWYIMERRKYGDHALMASEYPSDDIEAFAHSGVRVFDRMSVEAMRADCSLSFMRGEVTGESDEGAGALRSLKWRELENGAMKVWELPDDDGGWSRRYLTVVDVGGRSMKADWSVVAVFDRAPMAIGEPPKVVAQWRGHADMDILAWTAARIAEFYLHALLVIESNTPESRDDRRLTEGDQTPYIFMMLRDVYDNLYAREAVDGGIGAARPTRYGFHTNTVTKPLVISVLHKAVRERLYVERDEDCIDEFLTYERKPNGSMGAIAGCHDDLLMTRAIGLHICFNEMEPPYRRAAAPSRRRSRGPATEAQF